MTIGIYLSGGADSAMLLHKLVNTTDVEIVALTIASNVRKHNIQSAVDIVKYVGNVLDHKIVIANEEIYRRKNRKQAREELETKYKIDYWMSGKTLNPPVKLEHNEERKPDRDEDLKLWVDNRNKNPLFNINKRNVYNYYVENDLLDLWELTISCEYSIPPCNSCWWCSEREWANG